MNRGEERPDERDDEWPERWGKRIGRILGFGLAGILLWYLLSNYLIL
jgi:hypothetical protein